MRHRYGELYPYPDLVEAYRCCGCGFVVGLVRDYPRCGRCLSTVFNVVEVTPRQWEQLPREMPELGLPPPDPRYRGDRGARSQRR